MSWPHVDWSQAPEDAVAWSAYTIPGKTVFGQWHTIRLRNFERAPNLLAWASGCSDAPTFGYTGHPRDSLTLRPQKEPTP